MKLLRASSERRRLGDREPGFLGHLVPRVSRESCAARGLGVAVTYMLAVVKRPHRSAAPWTGAYRWLCLPKNKGPAPAAHDLE